MAIIEDFFRDIDAKWEPREHQRIRLQLLGCAALMLQANYDRGTKDSDVLETSAMTDATKSRLLQLAGKDTDLYRRHKLYIDIVAGGVPFLPQSPRWHALTELNARMVNFELMMLDVIDVVVSKLKRFSPNDKTDIAAMIERNLVPHGELVARFRSAVTAFEMDARAQEELPRYVRNFHQVERDELGVPETEIELPGWI